MKVMQTIALENQDRVLIPKLRVARSFLSRFMGLMGKRGIAADEALCFPKCNSIHTFFMRFPIDIVFVGTDGTVIDVVEGLRPWRLLLPRSKARHTVEIAARRARELGIRVGDRLRCQGVWN